MAQVLNPVPALSIFSLLLCKHLSCTLLKMACIHRALTGEKQHYEMDIFGVRAKIQQHGPFLFMLTTAEIFLNRLLKAT